MRSTYDFPSSFQCFLLLMQKSFGEGLQVAICPLLWFLGSNLYKLIHLSIKNSIHLLEVHSTNRDMIMCSFPTWCHHGVH